MQLIHLVTLHTCTRQNCHSPRSQSPQARRGQAGPGGWAASEWGPSHEVAGVATAEAVVWARMCGRAAASPQRALGGSWQCQPRARPWRPESGDLALHSGREVQDLAEGHMDPDGERVRVPKRGHSASDEAGCPHSLGRARGDTGQHGGEGSRGRSRTTTRAGSDCRDASSPGIRRQPPCKSRGAASGQQVSDGAPRARASPRAGALSVGTPPVGPSCGPRVPQGRSPRSGLAARRPHPLTAAKTNAVFSLPPAHVMLPRSRGVRPRVTCSSRSAMTVGAPKQRSASSQSAPRRARAHRGCAVSRRWRRRTPSAASSGAGRA